MTCNKTTQFVCFFDKSLIKQRSQNSQECKATYFGVKSHPFKLQGGWIEGQAQIPFWRHAVLLPLNTSSVCFLLPLLVLSHRHSACRQRCNITGTHSHRPCMNHVDATLSSVRRSQVYMGSVLNMCAIVLNLLFTCLPVEPDCFFLSRLMLIIFNFAVAVNCTTWLTTQRRPPSYEPVDMLLSHFTHIIKTGETFI